MLTARHGYSKELFATTHWTLIINGDFRVRGQSGYITRIFGFLILAIAVQLVWDGVADFK